MTTELRKTGISIVGDVPWGTHFCYFYETKQDLLDILVPYFKAGLENNEFCLWIISDSELITIEEAKEALGQAVPDLDRYLLEGRIELASHDQWFLKGGAFDFHRVANRFKEKLDEALAKGYAGMRVNGSPAWIQTEDAKVLREFEAEVDHLFPNERIIASCTYPLGESRAAFLLDVARNHQFVIARRQGEWDVSQTSEPIQARAELKRLNEALLRVKERTPQPHSILSYGMAVLSVAAAVIIVQWMEIHLHSAAHVSLFLCAIMFSAWFGGFRPGLLSIGLSVLAFAYFLPPDHSLAVETREIPRLLIFALAALFVVCLSAAQRSKAETLRHARDVLDGTVQELTRTNVALQAEIAERKRVEDALRRSEDRIRLVIDTIPTMAWSIRPDGAIDFLNQRWMDYTGLSLEEEIEEPTRPMHPEDIPRALEKWRRDMATGEPSEDEVRLRRADGKYRWFLVRTDPLRDEQGRIVKWYGVSTDIEDRKRAEDRLRATTEQLRALSARLQMAKEEEATRIARELHDELGSALTSLKWDLELLERDLLGLEAGDGRSKMCEQIEGMAALIDNTINSVRRISAELRPSMLDDLGLVAAIQSYVRQFQERTGIVAHFESSLDDVELTPQQSTAVFRIFQEALTNVIRHARATKIDLRVRQEDGQFGLTVSDNGRGITEAEKSDALSLGLLGMKERARLVGGEVDVTRNEEGGTVISVQLPTA